jgi:hypothetical protein
MDVKEMSQNRQKRGKETSQSIAQITNFPQKLALIENRSHPERLKTFEMTPIYTKKSFTENSANDSNARRIFDLYHLL